MSIKEKKNNKTRSKPVSHVELSEKNIQLRIAVVVLLVLIAGSAFAYALNTLLSGESGWVTIKAEAASELNCSNEFTFLYNVGVSGASASAEKKALIALYTDATVKAYELFNNDSTFEDVVSIYQINQHPNEIIQVDPVLYEAFSMMEEAGNRSLYLGPVYSEYDNMFNATEESQIIDYDPVQNQDLRDYFVEVTAFARDENAVNIELLGDNQIELHVSDEYLAFAKDNGITDYIDFFWMKNAFIIDYLADVIESNGYTLGSISSYHGLVRNLDQLDTSYSYNLFDREGNVVRNSGIMEYHGSMSIVYLSNYRMSELDNQYYYELSNGEIRTSFVDLADGLSRTALNDFISYSKDTGCAQILLGMLPVYISDTFDEDALTTLKDQKIYSIFSKDRTIYYNEKSLVIKDLFQKEDVAYTTSYLTE